MVIIDQHFQCRRRFTNGNCKYRPSFFFFRNGDRFQPPFKPYIKIHMLVIHEDILSIYLLKLKITCPKCLTIQVPKFNDVHIKLKNKLIIIFYKTHSISNKFWCSTNYNTSVVKNEQFLYLRNQTNYYYILELKCFWNNI